MFKISLVIISFLILNPLSVSASSGGFPVKEEPKKVKTKAKKKKVNSVIKPKVTQKVVAEQVPAVKKEMTAEDKQKLRAMIARKKASLNNLEWDIEVSAFGKEDNTLDIVTFKNGKVVLTNMLEKGFGASNFSLTIKDDDTLTWETMKTAEDGQVVFIKGYITPDRKSLRGVINYPKRAKNNNYSFKSTDKRILAP